MMRSNSLAYSSGGMNAFFTCSSSTSASSEARRCSSSTSTSSVGGAPAGAGDRVGAARHRAVVALRRGLAADAVAVVVEQRALGRELAALLVVAAHAAAAAAKASQIEMRPFLSMSAPSSCERRDEVLGEDGVEPLRDRVGRRDDDAPRAGEALDERKARRARVDDHDAAGHAAQQRGPLRRLQIGADQVELGVDAVERAVADQQRAAAGRRAVICDRRIGDRRAARSPPSRPLVASGVSLSVVTWRGVELQPLDQRRDSAFVQPRTAARRPAPPLAPATISA